MSVQLSSLKTGCNINNVFMNHFMYADDTVLVSPSATSLQKRVNSCAQFASANDILFHFKKTVCLFIKSKKFKDLPTPSVTWIGNVIKLVDYENYLGVITSSDCKDDADINRQTRSLYGKGNSIIRNFKHCSDPVKIQLFKTFCSHFYCSHLYNKSSYTKIRVAFKRIYRSLMNLDYRSSNPV
jgi:hypothetical protein